MLEGGTVGCIDAYGGEALLSYYSDVLLDGGFGPAGQVVVVRSVGDGPLVAGGAD